MVKTKHLFPVYSADQVHGFLLGFGSVLSLAIVGKYELAEEKPEEALKKDWETIGADLYDVIYREHERSGTSTRED